MAPLAQMSAPVKDAFDAVAFVAAVGVLTSLLNVLVGILTIAWFFIRIYDWWKNRNKKLED